MTWTQIDDGLNFSPQTMPGTVSNAALGLWVRLCVHTAYQLRFPAFDGAFDLTVVRSLKGNARQVAELEAAGMLEPALAAGRHPDEIRRHFRQRTQGEKSQGRACRRRRFGRVSAKQTRSKCFEAKRSKCFKQTAKQNRSKP